MTTTTLLLRCAVVGRATLAPLRMAVAADATVRELQRTLEAALPSVHVQMATTGDGSSGGDAREGDDGGGCSEQQKTTPTTTTTTTTTTPPPPLRLFLAKTRRARRADDHASRSRVENDDHHDNSNDDKEADRVHQRRWLRMDDPEVHALLQLLAPHDSSAAARRRRIATTAAAVAGATDAATAGDDVADADTDADVDVVVREYLTPELELLPDTKLLEVFADARVDDNASVTTTTSDGADGGDATTAAVNRVHVLVALPDDAARLGLQTPRDSCAGRTRACTAHSPQLQKRQRCARTDSSDSADSASSSATTTTTTMTNVMTNVTAPLVSAFERMLAADDVSDSHTDHDMDPVDASDESRDDSDDSGDDSDDSDDDLDELTPADDPFLLRQLRGQFDATPRERYELRPAQIGDAAVAALHSRLVRFEAEYGGVLGREHKYRKCVELILAGVCALFPRGHEHEPVLRARVAVPGVDLRVLATFDFTLQRGGTHVGVVVSESGAPSSSRQSHHDHHHRRRHLSEQQQQLQLGDHADEEQQEDQELEQQQQQQQQEQQHLRRRAMQQALQRSWLGAEVLADTVQTKSPRMVFGIVTSYTDWVFLQYDSLRIRSHEVTLQLEHGGGSVVPMKASLAEVSGLVAQMLR